VAVWVRSGKPSAYGQDADILTATSEDGGLTWSTPAFLNAYAAVDISDPSWGDEDLQPRIAYGNGHWLATWTSSYVYATDDDNDSDMDILMAGSGYTCGNGTVDGSETCDDGEPRLDHDCCSRTCALDSENTPCNQDADLCTWDVCDGAGTCEHLTEPRPGCYAPQSQNGSSIRFDATKQKLAWKWTHGTVTQADITWWYDTPYSLCLFDGASTLVGRADAPTGYCTGEPFTPCWKETKTGVQYDDPELTPNGVSRVTVRKGVDRAKLMLSGRGSDLDMPSPVASLPLRAQLVNGNGACWEASYDAGVTQNDAVGFKARGD
jgi:hypothetical protein